MNDKYLENFIDVTNKSNKLKADIAEIIYSNAKRIINAEIIHSKEYNELRYFMDEDGISIYRSIFDLINPKLYEIMMEVVKASKIAQEIEKREIVSYYLSKGIKIKDPDFLHSDYKVYGRLLSDCKDDELCVAFTGEVSSICNLCEDITKGDN